MATWRTFAHYNVHRVARSQVIRVINYCTRIVYSRCALNLPDAKAGLTAVTTALTSIPAQHPPLAAQPLPIVPWREHHCQAWQSVVVGDYSGQFFATRSSTARYNRHTHCIVSGVTYLARKKSVAKYRCVYTQATTGGERPLTSIESPSRSGRCKHCALLCRTTTRCTHHSPHSLTLVPPATATTAVKR